MTSGSISSVIGSFRSMRALCPRGADGATSIFVISSCVALDKFDESSLVSSGAVALLEESFDEAALHVTHQYHHSSERSNRLRKP
jgi:hypothetical protein